MKCLLEVTPEAERDIFTIIANIRLQDSLEAARQVTSQLKKQLNSLSEFPESGRAGGCDGTREIVLTGQPYIAIYEQNKNVVTILRVLYGADERRLVIREHDKKI